MEIKLIAAPQQISTTIVTPFTQFWSKQSSLKVIGAKRPAVVMDVGIVSVPVSSYRVYPDTVAKAFTGGAHSGAIVFKDCYKP